MTVFILLSKEFGMGGGIRTHTVQILSLLSPTCWTTPTLLFLITARVNFSIVRRCAVDTL